MSEASQLLQRALETGRVHSAYLIAGAGELPRTTAENFARALACSASAARPCEACDACPRSGPREPVEIDGTGKKGPFYRHIGDHPDLFWIERDAASTRVRIGQIRAVQDRLRLASHEGGRRVVVIADAEWINQEGQNGLLKLLEEPPPETTILLVAANSAGLLATIRSRCQLIRFPAVEAAALDEDEAREQQMLISRLDNMPRATLPDLLDWAEEYRGNRADAAARLEFLLATGSEWLRQRLKSAAVAGESELRRELDAFQALSSCRKDLAQRNANPQMVAERALLAVRDSVAR